MSEVFDAPAPFVPAGAEVRRSLPGYLPPDEEVERPVPVEAVEAVAVYVVTLSDGSTVRQQLTAADAATLGAVPLVEDGRGARKRRTPAVR